MKTKLHNNQLENQRLEINLSNTKEKYMLAQEKVS